jgi:hypothetical protein
MDGAKSLETARTPPCDNPDVRIREPNDGVAHGQNTGAERETATEHKAGAKPEGTNQSRSETAKAKPEKRLAAL